MTSGGPAMKRALGFGLFIGCLSLVLFAWPGSSQAIEDPHGLTFTKDVAPIIQKNCQVCHRPGEVAPMAFMGYKDVRPWARSIREKVRTREMPPWFADPQHGAFSNDCRLTQKEIDTIVNWVDSGASEGNPADLPPNPSYPEGWSIGKPDVVIAMPQEYSIPTEGVIPYKYFAVPTNFAEDKYVQFAEIR